MHLLVRSADRHKRGWLWAAMLLLRLLPGQLPLSAGAGGGRWDSSGAGIFAPAQHAGATSFPLENCAVKENVLLWEQLQT